MGLCFQEVLPGFRPATKWKERTFPHIPDGAVVSLDLETTDPDLKTAGPGGWTGKGRVVGVALATEHDQWYFPASKSGLSAWLWETLPRMGTIVMANCQYDLEWLTSTWGIEVHRHHIRDIQLTEPILDAFRPSYSLDALARSYLGRQKEEAGLMAALEAHCLGGKDDIGLLPPEYVGPYAEMDARLTWDVAQKQQEALSRQPSELTRIQSLEESLIPVLFEMRRTGVRIDIEAATNLERQLRKDEREAQKQIPFTNVWSAASLLHLAKQHGVSHGYTETGNPSFTKAWLEEQTHPAFVAVRRVRKLNKLRTAFLEQGILAKLDRHNILRCSWHQMRDESGGTKTGRMSASRPNLQQIPARTEEGKLIRQLFLTPDGGQWLKMDYSQQEPRLLTSLACRMGLEGAEQVADMYRKGGDIYQSMVESLHIQRDQAKTLTLGIIYGMGVATLGTALGMPQNQAENLRDDLFRRLPFLREIVVRVTEVAERRGYVRTLLGRHIRFNEWEPAWNKNREDSAGLPLAEAQKRWPNQTLRRAYLHKALNGVIQGSAADMTKTAMVKIFAAGHTPLLQVHDELAYSVHNQTEIDTIKDLAETAVELRVPVKAGIKVGRTW